MLLSTKEATVSYQSGTSFICKLALRSGAAGLLAALLLAPSLLRAQLVTGDVLGIVTDSTGAVVRDGSVTLLNTSTGISSTTKSNAAGEYIFANQQIGTYKLTIEATGFKKFVASSFDLTAGQRVRVDARLAVGSQVETVEIQGSVAPDLQTDTSSMGTSISTMEVSDLPLNGRNIVNLVQLSPGVNEGASNAVNNGTNSRDRRQTSSFSANGQNDFMNNNLLDGMDNNERYFGTIVVKPSIDAIDQVTVTTNLFPAEYSRTDGAVVNVITKSGGNKFHGSLYEYLRNDITDSYLYAFGATGLPKPELRQNQFGGSISGPIVKNKAFFFADYEEFRQVAGQPFSGLTVPSADAEQAVAAAAVGSNVTFTDYNADSNGPPGSAPPVTVTVPVTQMGKNLMALFPAPTPGLAGNTAMGMPNYESFPNQTQFSGTFDARIDEHLSAKDQIFGRYSYNSTVTETPGFFPAVTINGEAYQNGTAHSNPGPSTIHTQGLGLDWVHVYNPNLVLELKAGYQRFYNAALPANGENAATNFGFNACPATNANTPTSYTSFCINSPYGGADIGMTNVGFNSYIQHGGLGLGDGNWAPLNDVNNTFQYQGSVIWNHGAHSVKAGVSLVRRQMYLVQSQNARGAYTIDGTLTWWQCWAAAGFPANNTCEGSELGDMVEGVAGSANQITNLSKPNYRSWEPGGYIQDDWRARPWLTLNLGVRYDIFTSYTEVNGQIANFNEALGILQSPDLLGIYHSDKSAAVPTDYTNISPRLGFSASLPQKMVLRGGVGVAYFPSEIGNGAQLINYPFVWNANYGTNMAGPGGSSTWAPYPGMGYSAAPIAINSTTYTSCYSQSVTAPLCDLNLSSGLPEPFIDSSIVSQLPAGAGMLALPQNLKPSRLVQFSLQLQKEMKANVVTLGYVGNIGRHLPINVNINSAAYATPSVACFTSTNPDGSYNIQNQGCNYTAGPTPYNPTPTTTTTADGQNILGDTVSELESAADSFYSALEATYTRHLASGLSVDVNYTWAHALSNGAPQGEGNEAAGATAECPGYGCRIDTGNGTYKTITNFKGMLWSNSDLDIRHRITGTLDYELPFAKSANGVLAYVAKGWNLNTLVAWETGLPDGWVTNGQCNYAFGGCGGMGGDIADEVKPLTYPHKLTEWFDITDQGPQYPGTMGNFRRNSIIGPKFRHWDMAIAKDFKLTEAYKLQFRAESFNLTNTADFSEPGGGGGNGIGHGNEGVISALVPGATPREFQFALRLTF
jgi:hypothetical protein